MKRKASRKNRKTGIKARIIREVRKHPVYIGIVILVVCFALEKFSDHYLWAAMIETGKAAGVIPLWDTISSFIGISSDIGK